jgi:hypothetical protein
VETYKRVSPEKKSPTRVDEALKYAILAREVVRVSEFSFPDMKDVVLGSFFKEVPLTMIKQVHNSSCVVLT